MVLPATLLSPRESNRDSSRRLAVLIDADNAQPSIIDALLVEIASYGTASVKRIYGDWTKPNLAGWKDQLLRHSIQPIQQFAYTSGKNATDSALIIDAMDLLYGGRLDGFCLVTSDSDFTRLAARIREEGLTVYGFGEHKTPQPFVAACDKFIYVEVLRDAAEEKPSSDEATTPALAKRRNTKALKGDARLMTLLRGAVEAASGEDGWAGLGAIGSLLGKQASDFDPRNYGYAKLSGLIGAIDLFEIEERTSSGGSRSHWVREKKKRAAAR